MSFIFASSHLPETRVQRPEDEEEDDVQPMLHSGGVRAFSHLPAKRAAADPAGPLSQRGAQALDHQFQRTETQDAATPPEDGIAAAKASGVFDVVRQQFNRDDSPHFMDEDGNLRPRDEARQQDSLPPVTLAARWALPERHPARRGAPGTLPLRIPAAAPAPRLLRPMIPDLGICRPSPPRISILSTPMMMTPPVPIPPSTAGRRSMTSCTAPKAPPQETSHTPLICTWCRRRPKTKLRFRVSSAKTNRAMTKTSLQISKNSSLRP